MVKRKLAGNNATINGTSTSSDAAKEEDWGIWKTVIWISVILIILTGIVILFCTSADNKKDKFNYKYNTNITII